MKIVVFCGGSGTRLWPMGRKHFPKQFHALMGEKTMFQLTMDRLRNGFSIDDIFVCTGQEYRDIVLKQYPELPAQNIIEEPDMRDTAAAVAFSAAYIHRHFPGEMMAVIWGADHIIKKEVTFVESLFAAEEVARTHQGLAFIGIEVKEPNIHIGYIEMGEVTNQSKNFTVHAFRSFKEKPNYETAKEFVESKRYAGNAGYFVVLPETLLGFYKTLAPEFYPQIESIYEALSTSHKSETVKEAYASFPKKSVDYVIFEKLDPKNVFVIPAELGWSDIGSWNILHDEQEKDAHNNAIKALHKGIDTKGCLIYGEPNKLITTIGLEDFIIVDTKDALLICPKNRDQEVKTLVKEVLGEEEQRYI